MKSIYKKINISYTLLFLLFISLLSGLFKDIIVFVFIIVIHEIGHIISSFYYGWKIDNIRFSICGGYLTYNQELEKPFIEEFVIAISGFLAQLILFIFCAFLYKNNVINSRFAYLLTKYNVSVFIFNLLPIIPLDGSKVLDIILNNIFPYKKSLVILSVISLFTCIAIFFLLIYNNIKIEYSYIIMLMFLIKNIYKYYKNIPYMHFRFLLERYIKPLNTTKYKIILGSNLSKMYKNKKHIFIINGKKVKESLILSKKFDYFNKV